jgi:membrane protein DedA with SNARE-associated domain
MEALQPHLDFLTDHRYVLVFGAFLVEAAGIPFPSRLILLIAATLTERMEDLPALIALSALGAVLGDHVPYTAGRLVGPRLLSLYCRLTLGSARCVEKAVAYFVRFGRGAILLSRFSASIRIFASVLSGCGHIPYRRFLGWDIVGSLLYATVWASVGYIIGDQAADLLKRFGGARVLLLIGPIAFVALLAYRWWNRSRLDPGRATELVDLTCPAPTALVTPASPREPAQRAS